MKRIAQYLLMTVLFLVVATSAALLYLYLKYDGDYSVAATITDDPKLPTLVTESFTYHGEIHGKPDQPLVVVLHGGPGNDYRYLLDLKVLEDDYRVLFYDQRGSGLSPRVNNEQLNLEQFITDLNGIIHTYSNDQPIILIGHSWGAMLATAYISEYPDHVHSAVLAEPGFLDHAHFEKFSERTGLSEMKISSALVGSVLKAFGESMHVGKIDGHARLDYAINRVFTTPIQDHPVAGYYRNDDLSTGANMSWRFGAKASFAVQQAGLDENGQMVDFAKGVDQWKGAALFIAGSENRLIGEDHQRSQMQRFNNASLVVIDGAGHTMIGEKPDETVAQIRTFLIKQLIK
jgi:proline iminopeptidase